VVGVRQRYAAVKDRITDALADPAVASWSGCDIERGLNGWPTYAGLATHLGVSAAHVARCVQDLDTAGVVVVRQSHRTDTDGTGVATVSLAEWPDHEFIWESRTGGGGPTAHKRPDCARSGDVVKRRERARSTADLCQHVDCWGTAERAVTSRSCPQCGGEYRNLPEHLRACDGGRSDERGEQA
jgi:hypothetical protein